MADIVEEGHGKPATGLRLSKEGRELLEGLAHYYGISMTAVAEVAIRELGRKLKLYRDEL